METGRVEADVTECAVHYSNHENDASSLRKPNKASVYPNDHIWR